MKNKYIDLIEQTFEFPQDEFSVVDNELNFHEVPLMDVIKQYGTPLKVTYLPKITSQIQRAKRLFNVAMAKVDYRGNYNYCYCTKSSHFSFVLEEALKNDINLETSSAYDIHIIDALYDGGIIDKNIFIICNGSSVRSMSRILRRWSITVSKIRFRSSITKRSSICWTPLFTPNARSVSGSRRKRSRNLIFILRVSVFVTTTSWSIIRPRSAAIRSSS